MPEQLDWIISAAPDLDEPVTGQPSPRPIRKASRKARLILAVAFMGALAALAGFGVWNDFRIRQDVEQVVLSEERAARTGDVAAILDLTDPSDWTWRQMQLRLAANNQPAPLPAQALRLMPTTKDTIAFTPTAPGEMRADVTRFYLAPDGSRLAFTLPQFYRFEQGAWKRIAPPVDWNTVLTRNGPNVDIASLAADHAFVENDLGPYLDDVLQRTCAAWACPQDSKIKLQFASSSSLLLTQDQSPMPRDEPLLFAFVRSKDLTNWSSALLLPAPRLAGYPADTASTNWLKRAIAVQVLSEVATQLTVRDGHRPSHNAFLFALVGRMAANLGLESAQAVTLPAPVAGVETDTAGLSRNVNLMWDLSQTDGQGRSLLGLRDAYGNQIAENDPAARDRVLRSALAMTNWLLRDQPIETENKLFRALATAPDQSSWLSQGLGISPDEAWARLQLAAWRLNGSANRPELALACSAGTALASPGQAQPTYFLPGNNGWSGMSPRYSPDGKWLVVERPGGPLAVDLHSGSLVNLATQSSTDSVLFRGWITDSVFAYIVQTGTAQRLSTVHFLDVANPKRSFQPALGIREYELSPDKRLAAVLITPGPQVPEQLKLAVMPAWGGTPTWIDDALMPDWSGSVPAWSPDSQSIAYVRFDPTGGPFTVRILDVTTGLSRQILSNLDLNVGAALSGLTAWSPSGQQIAFVFQNPPRWSASTTWLGVVNTDGSNRKLLRKQAATYTMLDFSADGTFLATTSYDSNEDFHTVIYDPIGGNETIALGNTWSYGWSSIGHDVAVINSGGTDLITDLRSLQRQKLTSDYCSSVAWNPAQ